MQNLSCSGNCYKGDSLEVDGPATPLSVVESMVSIVVYLAKNMQTSDQWKRTVQLAKYVDIGQGDVSYGWWTKQHVTVEENKLLQ